jgi:hypothetical protein
MLFSCPFARAAWFAEPWCIRSESLMMRAKPEGVPNLHGLTRVSVIAEEDSRGSG